MRVAFWLLAFLASVTATSVLWMLLQQPDAGTIVPEPEPEPEPDRFRCTFVDGSLRECEQL